MNSSRGQAVELVEVYLASLWKLLPDGSNQVIEGLRAQMYNWADFTYDRETGYVKVICKTNDVLRIHERFQMIIDAMEPLQFVETDGTIKKQFETDLVAQRALGGDATVQDLVKGQATVELSYELPAVYDKYAFKATWTKLENLPASMTVRKMLPRIIDFQTETGVRTSHDVAGKTVYLACDNKELLVAALARLDVLLFRLQNAKIFQRSRQHFLYVEGYVDRKSSEFYADTRYLANIDQRLLSTTFLDRLDSDTWDYLKLIQKGVSIRLCPYDSQKGHHVSIFGMGVRPDAPRGLPSTLGNRPQRSLKARDLSSVPPASMNNIPPPDRLRVENWVKNVPATSASVDDNKSSDRLPGITSRDIPVSPAPVPASLVKRSNVPSPAPAAMTFPAAPTSIQNLIELEEDLESVHKQSVPRSSPRLSSRPDTAEVIEPSLEMEDLIDLSSDEKQETGATALSDDTLALDRFMPALEPEVLHHTMRQQAGPGRNTVVTLPVTTTNPSKAFNAETEAMMRSLFSYLEYFPGKVEIRADFGRIILAGLDNSALPTNTEGQASNGWSKSRLLNILNNQFDDNEHIHFSRILSTDASDAAGIIAMRNSTQGMWEAKPFQQQIVYSLYCSRGDTPFIVDICDDKSQSQGGFSYSIRMPKDERRAVWIHGLRRDWDMRFTVSYTDTSRMEREFGDCARMLLRTLEVKADKSKPFGFSVHRTSGFQVDEARVLTKWRHASKDKGTALSITEVEDIDLRKPDPASLDQWQKYQAISWDKTRQRKQATKGEPCRWYQVSIMPLAAEAMLAQNQALGLGQKAGYTFEDLFSQGGLRSLSNCAFGMLRNFDSVGYNNQNGQLGQRDVDLPPANGELGTGPVTSTTGTGAKQGEQPVFW